MLEVRNLSGTDRWQVFWSGQLVGALDLAFAWRPQATFYADDGQWLFRRRGTLDSTLLVEQPEGTMLGWAAPASTWGARWTLATPYGQLTLHNRAGRMEVANDHATIGWVVAKGLANRSVTVQLPPDVHLWVQVFLAWVMLLWVQSAVVAAT